MGFKGWNISMNNRVIKHTPNSKPILVFVILVGVFITLFWYVYSPAMVSDHLRQMLEVRRPMSDAVVEQRNRQRRVARICKKKKSFSDNLALAQKVWVLDPIHSVAYKETPKVGSTAWMAVMGAARFGLDTNDVSSKLIVEKRHTPLSALIGNFSSIDDIKQALQSYKKFVFVRHPLSRLLSAFIDKIDKMDYRKALENEIMKHSTNKTAKHDKSLGKPISFRDFVRYIIHTEKPKVQFNRHWMPLTLLLQPCQMRFDFIGKLETIGSDSSYIFQNLFRDSSLTLPRLNAADKKKKASRTYTKSIQEYYNELTAQELVAVIDVYKDDFEVFGYSKTVSVH